MIAKESNAEIAACCWIHPAEAVELENKKIILFGAGKGSEEFIALRHQLAPGSSIEAVIDNDASLWGKVFIDQLITSPDRLQEVEFDKIVVTSISGRDAIAAQLTAFGLRQHDDFILIGRYPCNPTNNFRLLLQHCSGTDFLKDSHCLHIGPGGFLGIEALLFSFGAAHIHSIDKFSFAIDFPDVTKEMGQYRALNKSLVELSESPQTLRVRQQRFADLFIAASNQTRICTDKIAYHYPVDVCELPFAEHQFDLVLSFAVLEHILDPTTAVRQLARVLRPGGLALHSIITRDHRSFSAIQGFSPFSFRSYPQEEWLAITTRKFPQNRLLPVEWKTIFEQNGFTIEKYQIGERRSLPQEEREQFHCDFHRFSLEELGECDCLIVARKQP